MKNFKLRRGGRRITAASLFGLGCLGLVPPLVKVARKEDWQAYYNVFPTSETRAFRRATAGTHTVDLGNGVILAGWQARDFVRHVCFSDKGDAIALTAVRKISFHRGEGGAVRMNYMEDCANVEGMHSEGFAFTYFVPTSRDYLLRVLEKAESDQ